jgi:transposase-like protein
MNRNRSGRRCDREFKNNAVALVRAGRTITEVARDLCVSKWPTVLLAEKTGIGEQQSRKVASGLRRAKLASKRRIFDLSGRYENPVNLKRGKGVHVPDIL